MDRAHLRMVLAVGLTLALVSAAGPISAGDKRIGADAGETGPTAAGSEARSERPAASESATAAATSGRARSTARR